MSPVKKYIRNSPVNLDLKLAYIHSPDLLDCFQLIDPLILSQMLLYEKKNGMGLSALPKQDRHTYQNKQKPTGNDEVISFHLIYHFANEFMLHETCCNKKAHTKIMSKTSKDEREQKKELHVNGSVRCAHN